MITQVKLKLLFCLKKEKNKVKNNKHKLLLKQIPVSLYDTYRERAGSCEMTFRSSSQAATLRNEN